ncbi:MAG: hypothetical protein HGA96_17420 [Desulfobulbaceae bacterium]|nr:hypothetical protein [Desulfobulbaceae bacterium]
MANQKFLTRNIVSRDLIIAVAFAVIGIAGILTPADSSASWLVYHIPEYKGKVIEAGTDAPIEGAVVVVVYYEYTFLKFDGHTEVIGAQETLTDKNGEFVIPSFTRAMNPFASESEDPTLIIYKPGYKSEETSTYDQCFVEICKESQRGNIVFMHLATPNTDRIHEIRYPAGNLGPKDLPILFDMIKRERTSQGRR